MQGRSFGATPSRRQWSTGSGSGSPTVASVTTSRRCWASVLTTPMPRGLICAPNRRSGPEPFVRRLAADAERIGDVVPGGAVLVACRYDLGARQTRGGGSEAISEYRPRQVRLLARS